MMSKTRLSLRIDLPCGARLGPGKAALLRALQTSGSIKAAAASLNMSYPRALKLIDQMNTAFRAPVVVTQHGGAARGGAEVTQMGQDILALYDGICADAASKSAANLKKLSALTRD